MTVVASLVERIANKLRHRPSDLSKAGRMARQVQIGGGPTASVALQIAGRLPPAAIARYRQ